MHIAIVAPSSVPFCIGGAENLWWGLLNSINQYTVHQADLIKLPSPESNFWQLIDSYHHFSTLDLSHFDLLISGKYPGWMVHHHNHTCYMLHRLRGLYDTYHFTGQPETLHSKHPKILALQSLLRESQGDLKAQASVFSKLEELRHDSALPPDVWQFPGALAREVIHFLDRIALAPNSIRKYAAISHNVTRRKDYFPSGVPVSVVYPPSHLQHFRQGGSDYLFTISRLDNAKRISLLIQAMKHVKADIQLKIGGTGPDAEALAKMAESDGRIIFLGFVKDQAVIDLYANALAVPFIPYDEDYGLVTIEAMMSGTPVLTTIDSGGPNEFVINGETGYSVPPDPQALAEKIDYLCEHRDEARQMGLTGQKLVAGINWEDAVTRLLSEMQPSTSSPQPSISRPVSQKRKKITVALTFPVFPPRGGGQSRVFHLYRHFSSRFDVEFVTFTNVDDEPFKGCIAPHLYETRIPKSKEHHQQESAIESKIGVPITDVVMPHLYSLTPAYLEALKASIADSDIVVACHPYLLPAIQSVTKKTIWYEAQDLELELKKGILPNNATGRELLESTRRVENECCQASQLIMVCSSQDGQAISQTYGVDPSKIIEVPNGVDLTAVSYIDMEKRQSKKKELGLDGGFTALFLGSWHGPNLEAVHHIFQLAEKLPDVNFLVIGSVGMAFQNTERPSNVGFMGVVDEETKDMAFELADVALNAVTFGSGTNLKMLEYFAAGVPVISTPVGARGLGIEDGKHCIVTELEKFSEAISSFRHEPLEAQRRRVETARQYVQVKFDWQVIARNFFKQLDEASLL